jgi:hypothetical protein
VNEETVEKPPTTQVIASIFVLAMRLILDEKVVPFAVGGQEGVEPSVVYFIMCVAGSVEDKSTLTPLP